MGQITEASRTTSGAAISTTTRLRRGVEDPDSESIGGESAKPAERSGKTSTTVSPTAAGTTL